MPIFSVQQKTRPSGEPIPPPGSETTTPPDTRPARVRLHDLLFGASSPIDLPPEADLTQAQAAALLSDPNTVAKFQTIYCVLPPDGLFDSVADIRAWNSSHKFCTPVAETKLRASAMPPVGPGTLATGGRMRLQTQLGLSSLPGVIELTDETANALLTLPASQMVDAFRTRFCNPPVFYTSGARIGWIQAHPWCSNPPPVNYMPWYLLGGVVIVGGAAWWAMANKKSKKLKSS
jgi:hypothetical protein